MLSTLLLSACVALGPMALQRHPDKAAPFSALRFEEETPIIRVGDQWWQWVALDEVLAADIVAYCRKTWPSVWQKRVGEDLVEALLGMGHEPGATVDLTVLDRDSGERQILEDIAMTRENRQAVRQQASQAPAEPSVDRSRELSRDEAQDDLRRLRWLIEHFYSYRLRTGVDLDQQFRELESWLGDPVRVDALGIGVMKLLARFGDGHTRLADSARVLPAGYLPATLARSGAQWLALSPKGGELLDAEHPYLTAIDSVVIEQWAQAVRSIVPDGSAQAVAQQTVQRMAFLAFARAELGLPDSTTVTLTLADERGATVERTLRVAARPAAELSIGGASLVAAPNELGGGVQIGYLRLPSMDSGDSFQATLRSAMQPLKNSVAWILDVRGNGGGSREALNVLLPYFLKPGEAVVVNVAAYRLHEDDDAEDPNGFLANRSLYPEKWPGWNDAEKKAIRDASRKFRPDWELQKKSFSDWHYHVVSTEREAPPFHVEGPVVLLMDAGCFSATDIFLGAFSLLPDVTRMGEASSGGSGRTRTYPLPNSGLEVRLSSMASFRPDGRSYDGLGIEVDVELQPTIEDFAGAEDSVLRRAMDHLREALR